MHFQGFDKAPTCSGLTQVRYPHKAKQWHLGVGKCAGKEKAEGLFAIGASAETVVFCEGGFICPVKGHQQTTKPRHLNNHAWFHNGIPEGQEGCVYINAYHNEDSPIRWLQMAAVNRSQTVIFAGSLGTKGGGIGLVCYGGHLA